MDIKTSFISYICNQITNIEVKMVLEIRLSNMFSFRDEVTLDLQAAKIQTKKAMLTPGLPSHLSSLRIMPTSQALSTSVSC